MDVGGVAVVANLCNIVALDRFGHGECCILCLGRRTRRGQAAALSSPSRLLSSLALLRCSKSLGQPIFLRCLFFDLPCCCRRCCCGGRELAIDVLRFLRQPLCRLLHLGSLVAGLGCVLPGGGSTFSGCQ